MQRLVLGHLVYHPVHVGIASGQRVLVQHAEYVAYVQTVGCRSTPWQRIHGCQPAGSAPYGLRKQPQRTAVAQLHDELYAFVYVGSLFVQLAMVAVVVLLDVGPQDVATALVGEETLERHVVS